MSATCQYRSTKREIKVYKMILSLCVLSSHLEREGECVKRLTIHLAQGLIFFWGLFEDPEGNSSADSRGTEKNEGAGKRRGFVLFVLLKYHCSGTIQKTVHNPQHYPGIRQGRV